MCHAVSDMSDIKSSKLSEVYQIIGMSDIGSWEASETYTSWKVSQRCGIPYFYRALEIMTQYLNF